MRNLYVHVPFCAGKCDYCAFYSEPAPDGESLRRWLDRIFGGDPEGKVHLLKEYSTGGEVDDPWYSGDFRTTYDDVYAACRGLLDCMMRQ